MFLNDVTELRKKFNEIDKDGSGSIDMTELRELLDKVGKKPNETQIKALITKYDSNKDGVLQFSEFQTMIRDWETEISEVDDAAARKLAAEQAAEQPAKGRRSKQSSRLVEGIPTAEEILAHGEKSSSSNTPSSSKAPDAQSSVADSSATPPSPAGSGLAAAKALSSKPADGSPGKAATTDAKA